MAKVLLVDDEDKFREALAKRLNLRGYETLDADNGDTAFKIIRNDRDIDVVLLDRSMPGMSGEQTLKAIKEIRPEVQVVMVTGHGDLDSAKEAGKLDAFSFLQKPVELERLIEVIEEARTETGHAKARFEVPLTDKSDLKKWLLGSHGSRPLFIAIGAIIFAALVLMPPPARLVELLDHEKSAELDRDSPDINFGYAYYRDMAPGENIAHYYSTHYRRYRVEQGADGEEVRRPLDAEETAHNAMVMLGIIVVAALFWATGAVPVGIAALLIGVLMFFFGILKPDDIAKGFAKDAVIFVFGVLAMSKAITKTGFDRRIGLVLLAPAKNLPLLLFLFLPMLSMTCAFVSEHALIAFTMPLFVMVYTASIQSAGIKQDRSLMVMFALALCYTANVGGPGSPAAGGRNAIMIGILGDYDCAPTFGEWVMYGLPFVPMMSLTIAAYFFFAFRKKIKVKNLNVSQIVRDASARIGPMNRDEYVTGGVLLAVIVLWITASDSLGMGGPVLLGVVALNILRILRWREVAKIHWDVVFLYAGAAAMGTGLARTGGALYLADTFVSLLPESMLTGSYLAIASSLFTGLATNFMSDGATVAALGPITIPMAQIGNVHPWMVGFATAYASSFAHMLIIGTPSNALAFALAKDPVTGEQLVRLSDFAKHGFIVVILCFLVLWFPTILGYWQWIGFPELP